MSILDPSARMLVAGDLEAVFLPAHGMLGASLRHRGVEILRRVEDLDAAAAKDAGIPLSTLGGYSHAQSSHQRTRTIALEPITAPASTLTSRGLRFVPSGEQFRAVFRIRVEGVGHE